MQITAKLSIATTATLVLIAPALLLAYFSGPDVGKAGVPGESTCAELGCHVRTVNSGPGSVSVTFEGSQSYTPGAKQHLVVTVADPNQRRWGFQLTARLANDSKTMAGTFTPGAFVESPLTATQPSSNSRK